MIDNILKGVPVKKQGTPFFITNPESCCSNRGKNIALPKKREFDIIQNKTHVFLKYVEHNL